MSASEIKLRLRHQGGYRFEVGFDEPSIPVMVTDQSPPLGTGLGPNPEHLIGAAVGNCLSGSLLFALKKFGNDPKLDADITVTLGRNDRGRMRVVRIDADLRLDTPVAALKHAERAIAQYEDFCVVTQSVRAGIEVVVRVFDGAGVELRAEPKPAS